jgi:nitrilase
MVSSPIVADNLAAAARLVGEAARGGADLVLLPEFFCILGNKETDKVAVREPFGDGPIQSFLANLAREHHIWLLGGTVPLAGDASNKVRNTLIAYNRQGEVAARYDKIHLFSFKYGDRDFDESRTIEPGDTPTMLTADLAGVDVKIGLSVCYDLRFPELYRSFGACDLLVVPSSFTDVTGLAHWEILLRARAIENQCYVLAAAQGGLHANGRRTFGHSILIDPWGEVVAVLPEGEGVISGQLKAVHTAEVRTRLPALAHRTM